MQWPLRSLQEPAAAAGAAGQSADRSDLFSCSPPKGAWNWLRFEPPTFIVHRKINH